MAKKGLLGLPLCRICLKKIYWATTRQERRNVSIKNSIGYLYTSSLGIWESGFGRCIFIRQSGIWFRHRSFSCQANNGIVSALSSSSGQVKLSGSWSQTLSSTVRYEALVLWITVRTRFRVPSTTRWATNLGPFVGAGGTIVSHVSSWCKRLLQDRPRW